MNESQVSRSKFLWLNCLSHFGTVLSDQSGFFYVLEKQGWWVCMEGLLLGVAKEARKDCIGCLPLGVNSDAEVEL